MTTHREVILWLVATFPNNEFPTPSQKVYEQELKHIPADELMDAARYHVHTSPYPKIPTIGELENALTHIRRRKAQLPDPFQAWGEVVRELSRGLKTYTLLCAEGERLFLDAQSTLEGYSKKLLEYKEHFQNCDKCTTKTDETKYSHPLIGETVKALEMTRIDGDNEGVQRAHFVKAYEQMIRRASDSSLPMLVDYAEPQYQLGRGHLYHPATGEVLE